MLPDDVYRRQLEDTLTTLEAWARQARAGAEIDIASASTYWRMTVEPREPGAAPFKLLLTANQTFTLGVAGELYEDKPIDRLDFFPDLARAIEAGDVERIETSSALTGALEAVETRIVLEDGWAWVGERRLTPRNPRRLEMAQERRSKRFLPYSR